MEIESHRRYSLGHRAFFLFFSRKLKWPVILLVVDAVIWYAVRWLSGDWADWGTYVAQIGLFVTLGAFLLALLLTYLDYRVYTYAFTDEAFVMTSGFALHKEVAALYHQIQNVNINRSPMNRMIGVSEVAIFLTGSDRDAEHAKIILPAVGKARAKLVQRELLTRARKHVAREERW